MVGGQKNLNTIKYGNPNQSAKQLFLKGAITCVNCLMETCVTAVNKTSTSSSILHQDLHSFSVKFLESIICSLHAETM